MKWIKNNIKLILLGIVVVLLLSSGVMNWIQDKWFKDLRSERDDLIVMNENLRASFLTLDKQYDVSQKRILALQITSDSLKRIIALKQAEIASKEKAYRAEIDKLKSVPPDTVYKRLFTYYPNNLNQPLKYPFAETQVIGFYQSRVELDYSLELNNDLNEQVTYLGANLIVKDEIIKNKDVQIGTLSSKVILGDQYSANLSAMNKNLERSYKSERRGKRIYQGVAAAELVYIIFKGVQK